MSRIHEALKQAEKERSARLSSGTLPDLVDVVKDVSRTTVPREDRTSLLANSMPVEGDSPLCFDEIVMKCPLFKWQLDPRIDVFHAVNSHQTGAESFRTLRSRLYQIAAARKLKSVLVTSSIPEEGKTFVAANLAQSIARQDHQRVLLIDADLRMSRLHHALGAPATPGLTDYLRGEANETAVIQRGLEGNLCFIPCGSPVAIASELLLGDRMKRLLDRVTPIFDWLVIDSPPALPVHDASVLADLCDGVLFVVRAGQTDFETAEKASVEFRNKNLLGVVLNRVEKRESYGAYHYGYSAVDKEKN
jgi:protein-tyrosine kinase